MVPSGGEASGQPETLTQAFRSNSFLSGDHRQTQGADHLPLALALAWPKPLQPAYHNPLMGIGFLFCKMGYNLR